jgi:hypothetical protein
MTETVTSVFGDKNATPPLTGKISKEATAHLRTTREIFNITTGAPTTKLKERLVEEINKGAFDKLGENRWIFAARAVRGIYSAEAFAPKSEGFFFHFVSATGQPFLQNSGQSKGTYRISLFGLARSTSAEGDFEGPATLLVFGFTQEDQAKKVIDSLRPGSLYIVTAKLQRGSPRGVLAAGSQGTLSMNAGDSFVPAPPGTQLPWADPSAKIMESFPLTPILDLLMRPQKYTTYHVAGVVHGGNVTAGSNGSASGFLRILDDSVDDPTILKRFEGGLFFFLPKADAAKGRLPNGSIVEVLVSGYQRKQQAGAAKEPTGDVEWSWNAFAIHVIVANESPTAGVPDPAKPAISIEGMGPTPEPEQDPTGLGLGDDLN